MPEYLWQIFLQILLIATNAVFACAEIAVISINDTKLEKMSQSGNKKAKRLLSLTSQPAKFLATIQVGITLAGFLGSAFAADNFSGVLAKSLGKILGLDPKVLETPSLVVVTFVLAFFTLVFGELVPKRIAMTKAEAIGLSMSGFVWITSKIFAPIVWFLTASTNSLLRLCGIDPSAAGDEVTEEEIRMMCEKGSIDAAEKEFINNLFEFDNTTASEIMTYRIDTEILWMEDPDEIWHKTIMESGHTMYPVCEDRADNVKGILNTKVYFRLNDKTRDSVLKNAVKPAQFVPNTVRADVLFENMRKSRNHFAIVVDERGGMSGIVTISDLLGELVGNLDEDAPASADLPLIKQDSDNSWTIAGSSDLVDVAKALNITLPCEEYDTFAGMVLGFIGSIPSDGSNPEVELHGLRVKILKMKDRRLEWATVAKI